jgi:hypothetical protein
MTTEPEVPPAARLIRENGKEVREPGFAKRLQQAMDNNPYVPDMMYGRMTWVRKELESRFGVKVSLQGLGRWYYGETKPKVGNLVALAKLLDVDSIWLAHGIESEMTPREQKVRNALVDGAVNLVAGLIQMNGGHPAFPESDDERAEKSRIDLYAIIKGAQYAFHVSTAQEVPGAQRFILPTNYMEAFQMGVVLTDMAGITLIEITEDLVEQRGTKKGHGFEVILNEAEIEAAKIHSLRNRL